MELNILTIPNEMLQNILSYLSYDEIARLRLVGTKFDAIGKSMLNQGFLDVENFHAKCFQEVKKQLPRRESERRKHALARHSEVLTAVETRLSLLGMTYIKYINSGYCCFIPGKVIDEIYKILHNVQSKRVLDRSHDLLQEFRDISTMAMEHFDEKICPLFKERFNRSNKLSVTRFGQFSGYPCSHTNLCQEFENRLQDHLPGRAFAGTKDLMMYQKVIIKTLKKKNEETCEDDDISNENSVVAQVFQSNPTESLTLTPMQQKNLGKFLVNRHVKYIEQKRKALELEKAVNEKEKIAEEQRHIIALKSIKIEKQSQKVREIEKNLAQIEETVSDSGNVATKLETKENKHNKRSSKRKPDSELLKKRRKLEKQ